VRRTCAPASRSTPLRAETPQRGPEPGAGPRQIDRVRAQRPDDRVAAPLVVEDKADDKADHNVDHNVDDKAEDNAPTPRDEHEATSNMHRTKATVDAGTQKVTLQV
jgi:hypothetical protein